MKKRKYRGTPVKKVNRLELAERVCDRRIAFGVDIGKDVMAGTFMGEDRQPILNITWQSPDEIMAVVRLLLELPARLELAMEPSGTYGDAFRYQCVKAGFPVFRVSAKRSHDAAEVYDGVPSWHDVKSAGVIARLHLDGTSLPWRERETDEREIAAAMRVLGMFDRQMHCNLNRIEAQLARHWPELTKHLRLSSLTLLHLLGAAGGPDWVVEDPARARRMLRRWGRAGLTEDSIEGAVKSAMTTIGAPMIELERQALRETAKETLRCHREAKQARAAVEKLVATHEEGRALRAVVGPKAAAAMLANGMNPLHYDSPDALLKGMGLNLREKSSGKHQGQLKITKRGPGEIRFYLYLAVLRLKEHHSPLRWWYDRKVARDGGVKNKAVIALMRDIVKALWYVARGDVFDPDKLVTIS